MKLVIVLIAVLLLVWLVLGSVRRRTQRKGPGTTSSSVPPPQVEGMVACAHCGVHLPASLALHGGKQVYCNPTHRDAGPRER